MPEFSPGQQIHDSERLSGSSKTRLRSATLAWLVAAATVIVAVVLVVSMRNSAQTAAAVVRVSLAPPANTAISAFAISPDSRTLAIVAVHQGKTQLWLRRLDTQEPQAIPGTEGVRMAPFWSPDSRSLGFFANGELKRADIATGLVQTICKVPRWAGGAWNKRGVILFTTGIQDPLFRVSESGGVPVQVTRFDSSRQDESHRWPWFLPDDHRFLFYVRASLPDHSGVYLGDINGTTPKRILDAESGAVYVASGHLLFVRQGILYARSFDAARGHFQGDPLPLLAGIGTNILSRFAPFSVSNSGILVVDTRPRPATEADLVWLDDAGRRRGSLGKIGFSWHISVSADYKRVAYDSPGPPTGAADIWIYDVPQGARTRLTFPPATSSIPVLARDGKQLVFSSSEGGPYDLFLKDLASSTQARLLVHSNASKYPTDWSLDGGYVLFDEVTAHGQVSVWVLPVGAEGKPSLWQERASLATFSPDGHWIAYVSAATGVKEVVVRRFPDTGAQWQVSTGGGSKPRWSPDGRRLFYLAADLRLMAVDVNMHGPMFQSGPPSPLYPTAYFFDDERMPYAIGPRGEAVLTIESEFDAPDPAPLTMVVNWPSLLPAQKRPILQRLTFGALR